ncbi:HNH endonuclease [Mesorhizobium sp. M0924]|uniref:HNH endonuclease signature motif containing protein n=1 Tax=unclassified Mesorhizobium TaxID=325217 RepID=UPI003337FA7E
MAANGVNLDALIPRADLSVGEGVVAGETGPTQLTYTLFMENDFFAKFLRKPEFQRETVHWSPKKIFDLVADFLDRRLVPAVILWRAGQFNFVVDGAHRISALMAWIYDDYGDGDRSKALFGPRLPPEQEALARKTRTLIDRGIGKFKLYQAGLTHPSVVTDSQTARMSNLTITFFVAQWVPATSAKAAEDSFFTINDAATPLDKTEKRIIRSRESASAIASRAIAHGGSGYAYWQKFPEGVQKTIVDTSKDIYAALYRPPMPEGTVDTLDVPVAGRGYSVLPFVFDLVNQVNATKAADSTGAKIKDRLEPDVEGVDTAKYLKRVWRTVSRLTSKEPTSLGLHPVVYFYTRGGAFSPWAFLAWSQIVDRIFAEGKANRFCDVRSEMERFLIDHKWVMTEIIHKNGSGDRSTPWLDRYWSLALQLLIDGKTYDEVIHTMNEHKDFGLLRFKDPMIRMAAADKKPGTGKFAPKTTTAAIWDAALPGAPKCPYCHGLWHRNSFHGDHINPKRAGGDNRQSNEAIAHPYCDATYKDYRATRTAQGPS